MPGIDAADAAFVRELVYKRAAILLDEQKGYLIESRLQQLVHEGVSQSVAALVADARSGRGEASVRIVEAITTHETFFFRDVEPFEALKKTVLPLLLPPGAPPRKLTLWSAACSSGQEPYSIAMMLLEHFPAAVAAGARIIATDLSAQILAKAREGRFRQLEVNRGLPAAYLVKYFDSAGGWWTLKSKVRALVEFRQLNLLDRWQLEARPDVIFMRNVLIYFDAATKRALLERARQEIRPDGALFLGTAETTLNLTEGWSRVATPKSAYYRPRPPGAGGLP
ncbi:MAG: protein-glutamate O-methyltransferase CheR [Archangiaceae bacterium]|nr:protein-glutamate O-methyltransferase CheR [Archangiaceae bacterium]